LTVSQFDFPRFSRTFVALPAFLLAIVAVRPASCQTAEPQTVSNKFTPSVDLSLGIAGQLTLTRTPTDIRQPSIGEYTSQTTQGTSPSAGVLGTFHQAFKPWLGYSVNLGYSRFAENYSSGFAFVPTANSPLPPVSSFSRGSIQTNMYETTIAYVVEGPKAKRFSTFAQIGGGGLWFLPTQNPAPHSEQVRLAMVFGVGMNYKLSNHFGLRAEYRGLFFKSPDFKSVSSVPVTKLFTVSSQPTVSLVYTFGGAKTKR
jgi:opacity protein-like surface antigen